MTIQVIGTPRRPHEVQANCVFAGLTSLSFANAPIARAKQEALQRRYIQPYLEALHEIVAFYRKDFDRQFYDTIYNPETKTAGPNIDRVNSRPTPGIMHCSQYPMGWCCEIRDHIFEAIMHCIRQDNPHPAIQALSAFQHHGGIISKLYGIVEIKQGVFFQNAIRIGNLYVDAALDAGLPAYATSAQVMLRSIEGGAFQEIATYRDFYSVLNAYNGMRTISMKRYFPELAPLIPAFTLNTRDEVYLDCVDDLRIKNMLSGFKLAEEYMTELGDVPLPAHIERRFLVAAERARSALKLGAPFCLDAEQAHPSRLRTLALQRWGDLRLLTNPEQAQECFERYCAIDSCIGKALEFFDELQQ